MSLILWIIFGYLCGSIPFSYIMAKIKGIDITKVGSGNVGGTNVLRSAGALPGILSMVLDAAKAFCPTFLAFKFSGSIAYLVALAAVLGHLFPIWLRFKGGKGVASTVGTYFALNPTIGWLFFMIWLPITLITKYVSLASIVTLTILGFVSFLFSKELGILNLTLAGLSVYMHKANIQRLINGNERKTDIIEIIKKSVR